MTYLTCPFCGEENFDAYGLKMHLWRCEPYMRVDLAMLPRSVDNQPTEAERGHAVDFNGSGEVKWKWAPPLCGKCYKLHHLGEPCPKPPKAELEIKFTLPGSVESEVT